METVEIIYNFKFPDQTETSYTIAFEKETLKYIPPKRDHLPEWTQLEHKQCKHCPLTPETHPHCPIASNLASLVELFKNSPSFSKVTVQVSSQERQYVKQVPLQDGIFSAFGLVMSLSACPYMDFLKPMARFHLPFSTTQETIVRSISFYLFKQYFIAKRGGEPDLSLDKLDEQYDQLKQVNLGIIARIRGIAPKDADVNAVIILHSFADLLTFAISNDLSSLESLFFPSSST